MSDAPTKFGSLSPEFATALVKVQGSIEGAKKGKLNPAFRSRYADLGACWDACRDALQESGIAVLQFPVEAQPGYVGLSTLLVYGPTGEVLGDTYSAPIKDGADPQKMGSAITYARRYALCSIIGICPEDDDGNKAAGKTTVEATGAPKVKAGYKSIQEAQKAFGDAKSIDEKKEVYNLLKTSQGLDEAKRAEVLKAFADSVKEMKKGETK